MKELYKGEYGLDALMGEVTIESPRTSQFMTELSEKYRTLYCQNLQQELDGKQMTESNVTLARQYAKQNAYFSCIRFAFGGKQ